jgi:hypothetical protein
MAALRTNRSYVPGKPPPNVTESRSFGAVLCFRSINCDYCTGKHDTCRHYPAQREAILADGRNRQCPNYKPAARG